jgi:hypothetical protein
MTSSAPPAAASGATALAKDRLGIPALLYFILSAMAPMTVVAGVVTTMYAVTGLSAIGAALVAPSPTTCCRSASTAWALPALFAVAGAAGVVYGLWLRSSRTEVYQGIGLGP